MGSKFITQADLTIILRKHALWLAGEPEGERANLIGANLSRANLTGANLTGANLIGANLYGANLTRANLIGANLTGANLTGANLIGADLYGANLIEADLYGANLIGVNLTRANLIGANLTRANLIEADLYGANLTRANLTRANLIGANLTEADLTEADLTEVNCPLACPEKGSFTAFKKVRGGWIVELEIPADALRSSATSRKCRCSKAKVISITDIHGKVVNIDRVYSRHDITFGYSVGETVEVADFDPCRWNECAPGIHFFITRQEAVGY